MRKIVQSGVAILALAAGIAGAQALTLDEVKSAGYVQGATANEVPYGYMKEDGSAAGIGPDVAIAVFKKLGLNEVNWTVTPFGTLIPGLKARRFDFAAAEQNISPERCKQVAFSEPNSSYGEGLLVKKGNPKKLTTYADIAKDPSLKVAVVSGANNIDFLRAVGVKDNQIVFIQRQRRRPRDRADPRRRLCGDRADGLELAKGGKRRRAGAALHRPDRQRQAGAQLRRLRFPAGGQGPATRRSTRPSSISARPTSTRRS